jgi:hypothetical protein
VEVALGRQQSPLVRECTAAAPTDSRFIGAFSRTNSYNSCGQHPDFPDYRKYLAEQAALDAQIKREHGGDDGSNPSGMKTTAAAV